MKDEAYRRADEFINQCRFSGSDVIDETMLTEAIAKLLRTRRDKFAWAAMAGLLPLVDRVNDVNFHTIQDVISVADRAMAEVDRTEKGNG